MITAERRAELRKMAQSTADDYYKPTKLVIELLDALDEFEAQRDRASVVVLDSATAIAEQAAEIKTLREALVQFWAIARKALGKS